jgi:glycerol-3-phosphate dehydrogenase
MTRDVRRLADTHFDLVVVGAGFYGALAAWDATLRGLQVALIDRGDFGSGASFNNFKTLHGGLRSLQALNLRQMRLFIRERRALARIAPHLVHPLAFVIPTTTHPLRSATTMRVALAINDRVSSDRHVGVEDPALQLPNGRILSRDECLHLNPLIAPEGVTGGALWYDYQMHNTDRMTFAFVKSAAARGAVTANYVEAAGLALERGRVVAVQAADVFTGTRFDIRARAVVNAAGAWAGAFVHRFGLTGAQAPPLSRAMNLVMRELPVRQGCGGRARGRFLFLVPWRGVTMAGTSHDAPGAGLEALRVTRRDVAAFLDDVNAAFPRARVTAEDVQLVHRGLLPMAAAARGSHVALLRESQVIDHAAHGAAGLVSIFSVRYTTARHTAAHVVDVVFRSRGAAQPPPCTTDATPVLGGGIANKERFLASAAERYASRVPVQTLQRLALTYGTEYEQVLRLADAASDLLEPLGQRCEVTAAEILFAARFEQAERLSDALLRRTQAGSAGHPGDDAVARAATILARAHGWDFQRTERERAALEEVYHLAP